MTIFINSLKQEPVKFVIIEESDKESDDEE
jgi:hypothetical protein